MIVVLVMAPFIGSFLGVLVERLPVGRGVITGRSTCPACGITIRMRDLVPVLGWLANRGRCRSCAATIGLFHPGIEVAALIVAAWAATIFSGWLLWASLGLGWTLLALACMDQRHFMLSDRLTLPLVAAGLAAALAIGGAAPLNHAAGAALGFGVFAAIAWAYRRLRGREGLGLGDAKLLAAGGAWVSVEGLASIVLWASAAALAAVALAALTGRGRIVARRPVTADRAIAFGPYLAGGIWLVWLYGPLTLRLP